GSHLAVDAERWHFAVLRVQAQYANDSSSPTRPLCASTHLTLRPGIKTPPRWECTKCLRPTICRDILHKNLDPPDRSVASQRRLESYTNRCGHTPCRCAVRIKRATRLQPTRIPWSSLSSAWIIGDPYAPFERRWIA